MAASESETQLKKRDWPKYPMEYVLGPRNPVKFESFPKYSIPEMNIFKYGENCLWEELQDLSITS